MPDDTKPNLAKATEKLRELLLFYRNTHNTPQMIEIFLLQAMARQKQGQIDETMAFLDHAVSLGRPGGYIRPFVNLDPATAEFLKRLPQHGNDSGYLSRILAVGDENECPGDQDASSVKSKEQPWVRNKALDNPLTRRELEILSLLGRGLRNKEIADKLFVSPETIKKHTGNIYRKLDSHSRQDAVVKAYKLGVIK